MPNKIKITFLGTSSAVPTKTRNHTSILLSYSSENILIDCGEGTQRQLRKAKLNPCKITRLLLTHLHGDHVFGIPGLLQTLSLNGYLKTLQIYGPRGTKRLIEDIYKTFTFASSVKVKYEVNEITNKVFETPDFVISALPLNHGIPTLGYSFQEKDKLRIKKNKLAKLKIPSNERKRLADLTKGKNIKINKKTIKYKDYTYLQLGKKISIILDTKLTPNIKKLAKDSDLAIIESTFLNDSDKGEEYASDYKHLTAKQASQIAKQAKAKQLALTHLSQRYEYKDDLILKEAKKIFPKTILAKDFLTIEI